jgi:hypothetical protein
MRPLVTIPYADLRGRSPLDLLKGNVGGARALVRAAADTYGPLGRVAAKAAIPLADRASLRWLARNRNPYLDEIRRTAEAVAMPGVYLLNVCFEWGCTSGVWKSADGPRLRRVLDWPFPELGEHLVVVHQSGPAGDFLNLTWPGMSGVIQASAPGRFAAAINQAPMRERGAGFLGAWLGGRIQVSSSDALPPAHLLRQVFETAPSYADAQGMLRDTPLAVPAIFILAGMEDGEGCVIERTETASAVRPLDGACVCATNHFEGTFEDRGRGWRARPIDSAGRLASARRLDGEDESFAWFAPPIANLNSRLAMTAAPRTGALSAIGTNGAEPVTERFDMSA